MLLPRRLPRLFALLAALAVAGCGGNDPGGITVDVIGAETAPFETGARLSPAGQLVRAATAEGLVGLDEQGRVGPAMADRWIITDDGRSYIFRLRDGTWADGDPITGETARQALRAAIASLSGTALGAEFSAVEDIRAMAGRVVEIRLSYPVPEFLQLLAQPELGLREGEELRGAGPMRLERKGPLAILSPLSPSRLGQPEPENWQETVREVRLHALSADVATRRFADGTSDVVLGGRFQDYALAESAAGLSRRALRLDPVGGLFGLAVVGNAGILGTAERREALAMAIDRTALAAAIGVPGWAGTTLIFPDSSAPQSERWADLSRDQRRALARSRLARKAGEDAPPPLRLALPSGQGADALYARIAEDFGAVGIAVARVGSDAPADLRLVDAVARYPLPEWYLGQLSCGISKAQCSSAADAQLAAARAETDPVRRAALLSEAEAMLTSANVFIPLGAPVRWALVRDRNALFLENSAGFHPLAPLARRPG